MKELSSKGLRIVIVFVGREPEETLERYVQENGIEAAVVQDDDNAFARVAYGGRYVPHLLLLGERLGVVFTAGGFAERELQPALERTLGIETY